MSGLVPVGCTCAKGLQDPVSVRICLGLGPTRDFFTQTGEGSSFAPGASEAWERLWSVGRCTETMATAHLCGQPAAQHSGGAFSPLWRKQWITHLIT